MASWCFEMSNIKCQNLLISSFKIRMKHKFSTAWKVSKYGVISGPYFPVFGLNTGKYGPEITPYLDTFHAGYTINKPNTIKKFNINNIFIVLLSAY